MKRLVLHIGYFALLFVLIFQFNKKLILNKYQPKELMVAVEVLVTDNDIFQLFYRESEAKFNEKNSQRLQVEASDKAQKLYFRIPDSINASFFRFDIGNRFQTSPVIIKEIALQYNGHIKPINNANITDYFKPNKFIEQTPKGYVRKVIEQRSDPFMVSGDLKTLVSELKSRPNHDRLLLNIILSFFLSLGVTSAMYLSRIHTKIETSFSPLFIGCFFSILVLPHLDELFFLDNTQLNEKRVLVKRPELNFEEIETFPKNFEAFYNDNFGFREKLVSLGAILKIKLFHTSPDIDQVIVGHNGWLFYWKDLIKHSYLNDNPFKKGELEIKADKFLALNSLLSDSDADFLVTIYPNKHSIYEDDIPMRIRKLKRIGPNRTQQLYDFLDKQGIPVVPHHQSMQNINSPNDLYLKNDTHWNSLGAYYAYRNIVSKLVTMNGEIIPPYSIDDFDIDINTNYTKGDLLNLLGIDNQNGIFQDKYFEFNPRFSKEFSRKEDIYGKQSSVIVNKKSKNDLTVLFFGDSFTFELLQFVPLHFRRTIFIRNIRVDQKIIESIAPDIIVYGIVERNLENF